MIYRHSVVHPCNSQNDTVWAVRTLQACGDRGTDTVWYSLSLIVTNPCSPTPLGLQGPWLDTGLVQFYGKWPVAALHGLVAWTVIYGLVGSGLFRREYGRCSARKVRNDAVPRVYQRLSTVGTWVGHGSVRRWMLGSVTPCFTANRCQFAGQFYPDCYPYLQIQVLPYRT